MSIVLKKKLERLPNDWLGHPYTTGNDQEWTYEYTWEDFDAFVRYVRKRPIPIFPVLFRENSSNIDVLEYFLKHPEKLLESKIVQEERPSSLSEVIEGIENYIHFECYGMLVRRIVNSPSCPWILKNP